VSQKTQLWRLTYDIAKRLSQVINKRFQEFGISLEIEQNIIPNDDTTLFVCSGMQQLKEKFSDKDGSKCGSLQSCVRTNDINLVGDGSHLTYFEMVGNFSFGRDDYFQVVDLWDSILRDLQIPVTHITYHPSQPKHRDYWMDKGYQVMPNEEDCIWSDGNIGGYCCEVFVKDLEIGNLVNTSGDSTDVGFGFERLLQVLENKKRVDETQLFRQDVHPVVRDHYRTLKSLRQNGIEPGYKNRQTICRRLVQRILKFDTDWSKLSEFKDWLESEKNLQEKRIKTGRRVWFKHKNKSLEFWKCSFGLTPEDVSLIREMKNNM